MSWWQIGTDVLAMAEFSEGRPVDPHNVKVLSPDFYNMGGELVGKDFPEADNEIVHFNDLNPAHQAQLTNDPEDGVISTTAAYSLNKTDGSMMSSRLVYQVKPKGKSNVREIIAEFPYPEVDLNLCQAGMPYPDPEARMK